MKVLVTGAHGFIGQALVQRLLGAEPGPLGPVTRLAVLDQAFAEPATDPRVQQFSGDIANPALLRSALAGGVQLWFVTNPTKP